MSYHPKINTFEAFSLTKVATTSNIDLTQTGASSVYTVPSGYQFISTHGVLRVTAANAISVGGTFSVGSNASSYDNILSTVSPAAFSSVNEFISIFDILAGASLSSGISAGQTIKFNTTVGITATTCSGVFDLFGYLV